MASDLNERNKVLVGMLNLCLGSALVDALLVASKAHGGLIGPWIDELEQKALDGVKSITAEGASIDSEAAAYRITLGMVEAQFGEARRRIVEAADEE